MRRLSFFVLVACSRTDAPASTSGAAPTASTTCNVDSDCVFTPRCCPGCSGFSGRGPHAAVTTRAAADEIRRACEAENRDCPTLDCASPPPCQLDFEPACVAGQCALKVGEPECRADACGSPPRIDDPECDAYRVALYERCTCLASGAQHCEPMMWRALCPHPARCEPEQPPPALAAARVECPP